VVAQSYHSLKLTEDPQAKQSSNDPQQGQWPSGKSFQGEQIKEQGHGNESESSSSTANVTTPPEPQTPNKTKAMCNAPVPIGWPKVHNTTILQ